MYFVYVIRQARTGYVKIGVSDDPEDRTKQHQTSSPTFLELWYVLDCHSSADAYKVERLLHDRYKSKRLEGEWFNIPYTTVIQDLDWCIEMSNAMLGGNHYIHQTIKSTSKKISARSNYDARTKVRGYLESHPEAIRMSTRKLASEVGCSKTIAHEELSAYKRAMIDAVTDEIDGNDE